MNMQPQIQDIADELAHQRNGALDGLAAASAMFKAEQKAKIAAFHALRKAWANPAVMPDDRSAWEASVPGFSEWMREQPNAGGGPPPVK